MATKKVLGPQEPRQVDEDKVKQIDASSIEDQKGPSPAPLPRPTLTILADFECAFLLDVLSEAMIPGRLAPLTTILLDKFSRGMAK